MDADGARELRKRIEEQQHWQQAEAVQKGEQPAADPDAAELQEIEESVRRYGRETHGATVKGKRALVTHRLCKRLVDGRWETMLEVERIEPLVDLGRP
jgi:hypothetical protein